jgi:glycosyltransferase involved in cell wall biosynthesis
MIQALRRLDVEVLECHVTLWSGIEDRVQTVSGGWLKPKFWSRVIRSYLRLLRLHLCTSRYDVMVVGYPGQFDVYLARVLSWLRRKPLVLDVFMSPYLIAEERDLLRTHPITGRILYWLEKVAYSLPDMLIQDTAAYVRWFEGKFGIDPARFRLVPTGADDSVFGAFEETSRLFNSEKFTVVYYGTFIPNHGVRYIVDAARCMRDNPDIEFVFIGEGPDKPLAEQLAKEYGLTHVTFLGWMDQRELVRYVSSADICLGAFGTTPQSLMTVQNKLYECMAMKKAIVTGTSPTVGEAFDDKQVMYLVPREDGEAIAAALSRLWEDGALRRTIAFKGYREFQRNYTVKALGEVFKGHLLELYRAQGEAI